MRRIISSFENNKNSENMKISKNFEESKQPNAMRIPYGVRMNGCGKCYCIMKRIKRGGKIRSLTVDRKSYIVSAPLQSEFLLFG